MDTAPHRGWVSRPTSAHPASEPGSHALSELRALVWDRLQQRLQAAPSRGSRSLDEADQQVRCSTEQRREFRAWTPEEMSEARGRSWTLEEKKQSAKEVHSRHVQEVRRRGAEAAKRISEAGSHQTPQRPVVGSSKQLASWLAVVGNSLPLRRPPSAPACNRATRMVPPVPLPPRKASDRSACPSVCSTSRPPTAPSSRQAEACRYWPSMAPAAHLAQDCTTPRSAVRTPTEPSTKGLSGRRPSTPSESLGEATCEARRPSRPSSSTASSRRVREASEKDRSSRPATASTAAGYEASDAASASRPTTATSTREVRQVTSSRPSTASSRFSEVRTPLSQPTTSRKSPRRTPRIGGKQVCCRPDSGPVDPASRVGVRASQRNKAAVKKAATKRSPGIRPAKYLPRPGYMAHWR